MVGQQHAIATEWQSEFS